MFVRLTYCKFLPEKINEARRIFTDEIVPTIRKQNGLIDVRLLEPTVKTEDFISITEWKTKVDADAYDNNGIYRKLVNKLEPLLTKKPELKTYTIEEVFEHV